MQIIFLPKTRLGKWAVVMFMVFIILAIAGGIISQKAGNTLEYPNPLNSPLLGSVIYLMFAASIMAAILGLIAVMKYKEHAILVYTAIPLGIMYLIGILVLVAGNIMGPPK